MAPLVILQFDILGESLVTLKARIRCLSGVSSHVYLQNIGPSERFVTVGAGKRSLAGVSQIVSLEATGLGERLYTSLAG